MFTASFTNTQGATVTNGIVMIGDAEFNEHSSRRFVSTNGVPTTTDHGGNTLRYRVFYWKSQADYDAGYVAYILDSVFTPTMEGETDYRSVEEKLWHTAQDLDSTYLALDAKAMAEKHLTEIVFAAV